MKYGYFLLLTVILCFWYFYFLQEQNPNNYQEYLNTKGRQVTINFEKLSDEFKEDSFLKNSAVGINEQNFQERENLLIKYIKSKNLNPIQEYYFKKEFYLKALNVEQILATTKLNLLVLKGYLSLTTDMRLTADARSYSTAAAGSIAMSDIAHLNNYVSEIQNISPYSGLFSIYSTDFGKFISFLENGYTTFPNFTLTNIYLYFLQIKLSTIDNIVERKTLESKIANILLEESPVAKENFKEFEMNSYDFNINKLIRYTIVRAKAEKGGYYFPTENDMTLEEMIGNIHLISKEKSLNQKYANWINLADAYYYSSIKDKQKTLESLKLFESNTKTKKDSLIYLQFFIGLESENDLRYFRNVYPNFLK